MASSRRPDQATPQSAPVPPPRSKPRIGDAFTALQNAQFRMLWFGMLFAQAAMQMNLVSRAWLAYTISGSAVALGLVSLARGLPQSALSLFGGAIADRANKKALLIAVQFMLAALSAVNAVLVHLDIVQVWHLVVLSVLQGLIFAFNMPTRQAIIPEIVPEDQLPNAVALNSSGMNLNRVLAPSLAGLLLAWHPALAFDLIAVFYGMAALMLLRLPSLAPAAKRSRSALADMVDGVRYVGANPALRSLIVLAFIPVMIGMPFQQLLPVFQKDVLHVGEASLGFMYAAVGVGSLIGSLSVGAIQGAETRARLQMFAGIAFGALLVAFALSPFLGLSLVVLAVVGLASQGYMTLNSVMIMERTDRAYYGRVMSIYMLTFSLSPVALLPMGWSIDHFGAVETQAAAGILLAALLLLYFGAGRIRAWMRPGVPAEVPAGVIAEVSPGLVRGE
ncbi:MAG: MFS transporter [Chloroflexi bacterium]|nr:MFS transporter [Chloroflexota bacterium]MDA1145540.1 MFS transporter [Chloroflexota bacterium]